MWGPYVGLLPSSSSPGLREPLRGGGTAAMARGCAAGRPRRRGRAPRVCGLALAPAPSGGARGARSCPPAAWLLERAACADGVRRGRRGGRRGQDPAGSGAPTSSAGIRWRHLLPWPAPLLAARRPATGAPPRCSHGGLEQREARRRLLDTAVFRTSSAPPVPARGPARGGEGRRGSLLCVSREDARPPRVPGPARH